MDTNIERTLNQLNQTINDQMETLDKLNSKDKSIDRKSSEGN